MRPYMVVDRPGGQHPPGVCEFTGNTHANDGKYVYCGGRYYSRPAVKELARALDLLCNEYGQEMFEKVLRRAVEAETTSRDRAVEHRALTAELEATKAQLAKIITAHDKLAETLAKTETSADVTRAAVAEILNAKKGKKSV